MEKSRSLAAKLFVLGFLTLFLELVLIRYLAGNIWNLGYFPNLVLLSVFIGMGIGFAFHHRVSDDRSPGAFARVPWLLFGLVLFAMLLRPVIPGFDHSSQTLGGEVFFGSNIKSSIGSPLGFLTWAMTIIVSFALISQRTAKVFRCFSPLRAYTLDISGSCAGIVTFMAVSFLQLPGYLWFILLVPLFWFAMDEGMARKARWFAVLPLLLVACMGKFQDSRLLSSWGFKGEVDARWSPYQKIEYINPGNSPHTVFVNGIPHQAMASLEVFHQFERVVPYSAPYADRAGRKLSPYRRVLVLGAGSGNDAMAALINGAEHVDAVEIDPVIARLGQEYHPLKPYADPRVSLTIDDGRAFMTRASARPEMRYDLIIFALTDSLVKVSPMSQLRLENYLFTEDSVKRAASLLNAGGDLLFYNFYRRPWLQEKIERLAAAATGHYPRVLFKKLDFAMLLSGKHNEGTPPAAFTTGLDLPTDDWPFLYLKERAIPGVYLAAMGVLAVLLLGLMFALQREGRRLERAGVSSGSLGSKLAFLFMGTAFLLLETKSVIQFSLLFGTTWVNNSLVFLSVLLLVLAANWTAALIKSPRAIGWIYVCLLASCMVTLVYPLAGLLYVQNLGLRFVAASLMTFSPIFFANLIFSLAFRDQEMPEHVFGWNLLGATVGGVIEYSSLLLGYSALAVVVAVCYTLAFYFLFAVRRDALARAGQTEAGLEPA